MARAPSFAKHLDETEWNQLEAFARAPGRTIDECHEWIQAKGVVTSWSAVQRWKMRFDAEDGFAVAADIVDAVFTANTDTGNLDLTKAATLQLNKRLVNLLATNKSEDTATMLQLARAAESLARTGRHSVKLEEEIATLKTKQKDALKAGEAAVKTGATADEALDAVRRMLGVGA